MISTRFYNYSKKRHLEAAPETREKEGMTPSNKKVKYSPEIKIVYPQAIDALFKRTLLDFHQETLESSPKVPSIFTSSLKLPEKNPRGKKITLRSSFIPTFEKYNEDSQRERITNFPDSLDKNLIEEKPVGLASLQQRLRAFNYDVTEWAGGLEGKLKDHNLTRFQMFYFMLVAYYQTGISNIECERAHMQSQQGHHNDEAAHHSLFGHVKDNSNTSFHLLNEELNQIRESLNRKEPVRSKLLYLIKLLMALGVSNEEACRHLLAAIKGNSLKDLTTLINPLENGIINKQTPFYYHMNSTCVENHVVNRTDGLIEEKLRQLGVDYLLQAAQSQQKKHPWELYREFVNVARESFKEIASENEERKKKIQGNLKELLKCADSINTSTQKLNEQNRNSTDYNSLKDNLLEKICNYKGLWQAFNDSELNPKKWNNYSILLKKGIDFSPFRTFLHDSLEPLEKKLQEPLKSKMQISPLALDGSKLETHINIAFNALNDCLKAQESALEPSGPCDDEELITGCCTDQPEYKKYLRDLQIYLIGRTVILSKTD